MEVMAAQKERELAAQQDLRKSLGTSKPGPYPGEDLPALMKRYPDLKTAFDEDDRETENLAQKMRGGWGDKSEKDWPPALRDIWGKELYPAIKEYSAAVVNVYKKSNAGAQIVDQDVNELVAALRKHTAVAKKVQAVIESEAGAAKGPPGAGDGDGDAKRPEQKKAVPCFAAGTPIVIDHGGKAVAIEKLRVGDYILSRPENDPQAWPELQRVEEVFVRLRRILHVRVRGRVIRTSAEHPFWVVNRGSWELASRLAAGDVVIGHDGQCSLVEGVHDTGADETVYNLRVADYHTYFVGCDEWGFSVWAHNTCVYRGLDANKLDATNLAAGKGLWATKPDAGDSIEDHVRGGNKFRTQWISCTKSETIARTMFGKYGVVAIDLDKVPVTSTVVDCSAGILGCTDANTNAYAIAVEEVVVKNHIPQDAIKILVAPP
jgi:hypothetical protein